MARRTRRIDAVDGLGNPVVVLEITDTRTEHTADGPVEISMRSRLQLEDGSTVISVGGAFEVVQTGARLDRA